MGSFLRRSRAANFAVGGRSCPNFEFFRAILHDRVKNWIENIGDKVAIFFRRSEQLTLWSMVGSDRILNSSKLLCMTLLPASMKRIQSKTAAKKWQHRFSHYKNMGIYADAKGQLNPQSVVGSNQISNSS